MSDEDISREDYTWPMAAKDLALITPLRIDQTGHWTSWAQALGVHPYDALPLLTQVVKSLPDVNVGPAFFSSISALVKLGMSTE